MPENFLKNRFIPYMGILNDEHMGIHNRPTTHHLPTIRLGYPTPEKSEKR